MENVVRADEQDVLLLELLVVGALGQGVQVAHPLVIAGALGEFARIRHLQLDVKIAAGAAFALLAGKLLPDKDVEADALAEGVLLARRLRHHGNFLDVDFQDVLQEILGHVLVAEDLAEHEVVGDVQLFVRFDFIFGHSSSFFGFLKGRIFL